MANFVPRLTRPEAGNKYYITKGNGGYSNAIKGSPTDPLCDVLSNCVGYAYGRFNEIGGYCCCKYLVPTNAENFIQYCGGLPVGQTPKLGACMVWRKGATLSNSDGAGHVAIVERIISDTQIVTSESGWNSAPFWTKTRNKGNGNWGAGAGYTFLGFIYNPAVNDGSAAIGSSTSNTNVGNATSAVDFNTSVPSEPLKYNKGDVLDFSGTIHFATAWSTSGPACTPGKVKITGICKTGYHQYHVIAVAGGGSTAHGWVDADKLTGSSSVTDTDDAEEKSESNSSNTQLVCTDLKLNETVQFTGRKHFIHANALGGSMCNPGKARVTEIYPGGKHPVHIIGIPESGCTAYGWVDIDNIKIL